MLEIGTREPAEECEIGVWWEWDINNGGGDPNKEWLWSIFQ